MWLSFLYGGLVVLLFAGFFIALGLTDKRKK